MHEKDDSDTSTVAFNTNSSSNVQSHHSNDDNDNKNNIQRSYTSHRYPCRHVDIEEDDIPPITFKRTGDMIGQQHFQHRIGGVTSPVNTGEIPMSGTSGLGTTQQDPSLDKIGGVGDDTEALSKASHPTTTTTTTTSMPLRPARVHKPPRQSRQFSPKLALSEYTTRLMYLEAVSKKHLKDGSTGTSN